MRSTKIKTLCNFHVFIPNEVIITDFLTNYHIHNTIMMIAFCFNVSRTENFPKIKNLVHEVLEKQPDLILKDEEGNSRVKVLVRGVSDEGLEIKVLVDIKEALKQYVVISDIYEDLVSHFSANGITIPYPS